MKASKYWLPSSVEQTCLRQLDRPGSWEFLRSDKPEPTQAISWREVRRIFRFNMTLFAVVFALLFCLMARGAGYSGEDFREDLPVGVVLTLGLSSVMALYAAHLYKRAWNRRAKYLRNA